MALLEALENKNRGDFVCSTVEELGQMLGGKILTVANNGGRTKYILCQNGHRTVLHVHFCETCRVIYGDSKLKHGEEFCYNDRGHCIRPRDQRQLVGSY